MFEHLAITVVLCLTLPQRSLAHGWGSSSDYDCGGTCGQPSYEYSSGGSHHGSSSSSSSYQKTRTSYSKQTSSHDVSIIVDVPQPVISVKRYSQPSAPLIQTHSSYSSNGCGYGPCGGGYGGHGGGSKIIKVIKKTTYTDGSDCGYGGCGGGGGYNDNYHQPIAVSEPQQVVIKKITRVVTQPKVVKVVKVIQSPTYEVVSGDHGGGGGYGGRHHSGSGGGAHATAFAYASASSGGGYGSGNYNSGGGCRSGCNEWKKKK